MQQNTGAMLFSKTHWSTHLVKAVFSIKWISPQNDGGIPTADGPTDTTQEYQARTYSSEVSGSIPNRGPRIFQIIIMKCSISWWWKSFQFSLLALLPSIEKQYAYAYSFGKWIITEASEEASKAKNLLKSLNKVKRFV